jgi:hypothetical protein
MRIDIQNALIKITLQVFYLMYKFGKKYAIVTGGIGMTHLIAMGADVAYQAIINNSSNTYVNDYSYHNCIRYAVTNGDRKQ